MKAKDFTLVDWEVDLDGPFIIVNDFPEQATIIPDKLHDKIIEEYGEVINALGWSEKHGWLGLTLKDDMITYVVWYKQKG